MPPLHQYFQKFAAKRSGKLSDAKKSDSHCCQKPVVYTKTIYSWTDSFGNVSGAIVLLRRQYFAKQNKTKKVYNFVYNYAIICFTRPANMSA